MNVAALESYANRFYGYGSWNQPIWFVGMEEGGCSTLAEFELRLNAWIDRGCCDLEDAQSYHRAINMGGFFKEGARLQKTWEKLIRIYLTQQKRPNETEDLRRFQINEFGRRDGGFASLELFALPSYSTTKWIYSDVVDLPFLINREVYKYYLYPRRAEELRRRIQMHRPAHVVIYGVDYRHEWEGIVRKKFVNVEKLPRAIEAHLDSTHVLVVPHPVSYGIEKSYWNDVGTHLKDMDAAAVGLPAT
jgi:hypothetical protein